MKYLIVIVFGLMCMGTQAQHDKAHVDHLVSKFIKSLEKRNINNYMYMYDYCDGSTEIFKLSDGSRCSSKGTYYKAYVFWNEDNETVVKKIDNCGLFYSLPIINQEILSFISANIEELELKVKKYEVETPENRPVKQSEIHSCFKMFQFNINEKTFGQTYNLYQLTNESKYKNLNFEYNNNLKIVELEKLLNEEIRGMEPKFRRQL
jgi:hypothetical protein